MTAADLQARLWNASGELAAHGGFDNHCRTIDEAASSISPQAAPAGAGEALADIAAGKPLDPAAYARAALNSIAAAPPSSQRVDAPLAATQGVTAPSVDALFANCDKWGAVEWFNRLAMAIRNRDKSVVEGNDLSFATYDNIAKSSAARLVHDFENEIRAALTAAIGAGGQAVEAPAVTAQPVAEAGRELVEKFWGVRLEPLPETNAANAEEASECMWTDKPCTCGGGPCEQVDFGNDAGAGAGGQAVEAPVVTALNWYETDDENVWRADSIIGEFEVGFDDGWYATLDGFKWEWEPEQDSRSYFGPTAGQAACQQYFGEKIRSALAPAPSLPGTQPDQIGKAGKGVSEEGNNVSDTAEQIVAEPVAWQYRWKLDGEWTDWRVSDHSQKASGLKDLEERPLYATPSQPDGEIERLRKEVGKKHDEANRYVNEMIDAKSRAEALSAALEPFAAFIEKFDAKPLLNIDDEIYGIHIGTEWEASIRLSDFRRARSLLNGEKGRG